MEKPPNPRRPARSQPLDFASEQDIEDADDVLFAHPPMRVVRWVCGCGQDFPCPEVRFAHLVKGIT